ncbi:BMP family lipoprotein [Desulfosediminicola flagellatus]|uniref:BMP family lipoprotein n=1 Tax=Desulfosediminicola flagellatus TaxID=2569541 RepID=UPI0010AC664B|nr:BMP family ABC transporter substrate-binding protein [Desulfosediminicola flagellatus]
MNNFFLILSLLHLVLFPSCCSAWTVGFLTGSGGLGDESFNDMTWKGIAKAREECRFNIIYREWEQELVMDTLMEELIDDGANLIVLNGDQFIPTLHKYAPLHPEVQFIANDFNGGELPNLKSIIYSQHEGAFLAGALAALHSESGKVGFIGAIDIPIIESFKVGFIEGVRHVSPSTTISVEHISQLPDYSGFNNPGKAYSIATDLYNQGIDVIFAVAGLSGNGVILAASANNTFVIGVDADQDHMARGHVLTSVMKHLDKALFTETLQACRQQFEPGVIQYGFKNGGISLTEMKYTHQIVGSDTHDILNVLKNDIISGKIIVTDILSEHL